MILIEEKLKIDTMIMIQIMRDIIYYLLYNYVYFKTRFLYSKHSQSSGEASVINLYAKFNCLQFLFETAFPF